MDSIACSFNLQTNMADGSCEFAEEGYDCDGNINVQIGDEAFGGIVFYVDESGEHGLVSALEDLPGTYEWGCYGISTGANGQGIGTGYQNTMDIVNSGCFTDNGGITAAQATLGTLTLMVTMTGFTLTRRIDRNVQHNRRWRFQWRYRRFRKQLVLVFIGVNVIS